MDVTQVLVGSGVLGGVILAIIAAPRVWRPTRRLVAVIDALAGRPPRYHGDPEARPGLVERLDRIEWHVGNGADRPLRAVVEDVRRDVAHLKGGNNAET